MPISMTLVGNAGDGAANYDGAAGSSPFDWGATDDGGAAE